MDKSPSSAAKKSGRLEFDFTLKNIEAELSEFSKKGVTEFALHDERFSSDKKALLEFLEAAARLVPDVYVSIPVQARLVDADTIGLFQKMFCSLDIFLCGKPGENFFWEKKLFSKKAALLNRAEIVFGFLMDYARFEGDSVKAFRDRLDFALSLYPNHIEFEQLYSGVREAKNSATFSSQDIAWAAGVAFATSVFYSEGRAVSWFNSVLKPLKIAPSKFFSDFAEWQRCNNCALDDFKKPFSLGHKEIEKMQLLFLEEKYSEKGLAHLLPAALDIVRVNGAFSRLEGEGEECELDLNFNPDDLLGPAAFDLAAFSENVCMEECRAKIFVQNGEPRFKLL